MVLQGPWPPSTTAVSTECGVPGGILLKEWGEISQGPVGAATTFQKLDLHGVPAFQHERDHVEGLLLSKVEDVVPHR